jgi:hypothetical protein
MRASTVPRRQIALREDFSRLGVLFRTKNRSFKASGIAHSTGTGVYSQLRGVDALMRIVLVLSLFAVTSFAAEMTGYISDSKCGAKGEKDAHADCAVKCVKGGAAPVFVSDGKVYKIDDAAKVQDHIGHKVTITGEVKGDTIQVQEVKM